MYILSLDGGKCTPSKNSFFWVFYTEKAKLAEEAHSYVTVFFFQTILR